MHPDLTGATLIEHGCSGVHVYINRFGSMKEAIRLAGLDSKVMRAAGTRKAVKARSLRRRFTNDVAELMRQQNVQVTTKSRCGALVINGLVRVGSHLIHCERRARVAAARWYVRRLQVTKPIDAVLIVRMNNDDTAKDFFLVPIQEFRGFPMFLGEPAPERARSFQISTARDLVSRMLSLTPTP
jgi:hypothetical protein